MNPFNVDGLAYSFEDSGRGAPLVMLHGFTGSSETWRSFLPKITANRRVICIDLPGHGRTSGDSDPSRYQMERVINDLATILSGIDAVPADWLGYSMGGRLTLFAAVNRPDLVRSLILESASPGLESEEARAQRLLEDQKLADYIDEIGLERFIDEWEKMPLFSSLNTLPVEVRSGLRRERLQNSAAGLANSLRGMGAGAQPSLWPRLGGVNMPALLLAGELDPKFVEINQRMVIRLPHAQLIIIPGASHIIHLEKPEVFLSEVVSFLDRHSHNRHDLSDTE